MIRGVSDDSVTVTRGITGQIQTWGSLQILQEIGHGGFGVVYRAWEPALTREVALKILNAEEGNTAEAHERFRREAELAAKLHHANIVAVYDYGQWQDRDYMALQLIDGTTLASATVDPRTALAAVRDAARALHRVARGERHQGLDLWPVPDPHRALGRLGRPRRGRERAGEGRDQDHDQGPHEAHARRLDRDASDRPWNVDSTAHAVSNPTPRLVRLSASRVAPANTIT